MNDVGSEKAFFGRGFRIYLQQLAPYVFVVESRKGFMKKALQVLLGSLCSLILVINLATAALPRPTQLLNAAVQIDDGAGPDAPSSPDAPLCLPDSPCPDVPNLR